MCSPTPIRLCVVKYINDEPFISIPSSIMIGYKDLEELETRRGMVLIEIFSASTKYTQNQSLYQSSHPIYFCYFVFYNITIKHLQVETKIATRWPKITLIEQVYDPWKSLSEINGLSWSLSKETTNKLYQSNKCLLF